MQNMADIKEQIFQELDSLESLAQHLRADAQCASKQTDLEVAILTKQVKNLRERTENARELIEKSVSILEKLKKWALYQYLLSIEIIPWDAKTVRKVA